MAQALDISIVIPTKDSASAVVELLKGLERSGTLKVSTEVVVVDDGSKSQTEMQKLADLKAKYPDHLKVEFLESNLGRFMARYRGAQIASSRWLLFLDARIRVPEDFASTLVKNFSEKHMLMGSTQIDETQSVYDLYWKRTHDKIFFRNAQAQNAQFFITESNFEDYVKGTGCLLVPRHEFIRVCEKYKESGLHSDDTYLMRDLVSVMPILVTSDFYFLWSPRRSLIPFLLRLWERGPGFAEYHIFEVRGAFFKVVILGIIFLFVNGLTLFISPASGAWLSLFALFALFFSSVFFSKSVAEFIRLAPLHVASLIAYGAGILWAVCKLGLEKLNSR